MIDFDILILLIANACFSYVYNLPKAVPDFPYENNGRST